MTDSPRQLCTLFVADLFLGIDVLSVQEVLRARELTEVPLAPDTVQGLLNLRGQIVTTIDLRRRLGLKPNATERESMFVIIRTEADHVAFVVDSVGDVIDVDDSTFEPPPDNLPASAQHIIRGVHKLPERLLHLIDPGAAAQLRAA